MFIPLMMLAIESGGVVSLRMMKLMSGDRDAMRDALPRQASGDISNKRCLAAPQMGRAGDLDLDVATGLEA